MRSGDTCPTCQAGTMQRRSTRTVGLRRTKYLKCDQCHATGKEILSIDHQGRPIIRTDTKVIFCPKCSHTIHA